MQQIIVGSMISNQIHLPQHTNQNAWYNPRIHMQGKVYFMGDFYMIQK